MKQYNKKIFLLILIIGLVAMINLTAINAASNSTSNSKITAKSSTYVQSSSKASSTKYVSVKQVVTSATSTKNYIEKNKKIPSQIRVGTSYVSASQLLYLMNTATIQLRYGKTNAIPLKTFSAPNSKNENVKTGTISQNVYLDFAKRIKSFMDTNRRAPSYGLIGLGNVGYESQIYLYSRVLYQYQIYRSLPSFMNVSSWNTGNIPLYDNSYPKFTPKYVAMMATKVKKYYEANKKLPNHVHMGGVYVYMAQFLHLETTATLKLNKGDNSIIKLYDDGLPSSSIENLNSGALSRNQYLDFALRIKSYLDQNRRAPSYGLTGLGKMSYQTMIFTYSKILNGYNYNRTLPASVTISSLKIIKVLLYNGVYAGGDGVRGILETLNKANINNLIPGFQFSYSTSSVINSQTLSSYNLLIMPGGDGGKYYLQSTNINGSAIKSFVANGGGYIGICAGAYAAASYVDGWYSGWGIAPHIRCKAVDYVGKLLITMTSTGQNLFGYSGTKTIQHWNGPAMYSSGGWVPFATFTDGTSGYQGYGAIAGDYYGEGRVVLLGPHPELTSSDLNIIPLLIRWATHN